MISTLFTDRNRQHIKNKFKREEQQNPQYITDALIHRKYPEVFRTRVENAQSASASDPASTSEELEEVARSLLDVASHGILTPAPSQLPPTLEQTVTATEPDSQDTMPTGLITPMTSQVVPTTDAQTEPPILEAASETANAAAPSHDQV
jgi:hypothetical protein